MKLPQVLERECRGVFTLGHVAAHVSRTHKLYCVERVQCLRCGKREYPTFSDRHEFSVYDVIVRISQSRTMQQDIEPMRAGEHCAFDDRLVVVNAAFGKRALDALGLRSMAFDVQSVSPDRSPSTSDN